MPNPQFVPVIGSSFDALAGQQAGWAQFNRLQDEDNLRRMEQANRDYNNWLATVNMLDRQDVGYVNQGLRLDEATRYNRALQAAQEAEARRQFDVSTGLQKQRFTTEQARYDAALAEQKKEERKRENIHENIAKSMAETVKPAAIAFEDAQREYNDATTELKTEASEWEKSIPKNKAVFNPRTNEFESPMRGVPIAPELADKVQQANEALAKVNARFLTAKQNYDYHYKVWMGLQKHASDNTLEIRGAGKDAHVYSPVLDKSFGQLVEEQRQAPPPQTPFVATMPEAFRAPTPAEMALGGPTFGTGTTMPSLTPFTPPPESAATATSTYAPPAPAVGERVPGMIYMTGSGPMQWMVLPDGRAGWRPANP